MRIVYFLFTILAIFYSFNVLSAESLAIEQLTSEQGKWRLGLNTVYANSETSAVNIGDSIQVQTGPGQYVSIPASVSSTRINTDSVVLVPTVRYGISENLEVAWRMSFSHTSIRSENNNGNTSESYSRFADSWLGFDYRLTKDRNKINYSVFADVALAENTKTQGSNLVHGRAYSIGLSMYRVYDPIVMTNVVAYQMNLSRDSNGQSLEPGDALTFSPGVSFAPNRDTNLNIGFSWTNRQSSKLDGNKTSIRRTSTSLNLGFAYAWSDPLSIFTSVSTNISGGDGASIGVSMVYEFEK